MTSYTFKDVYNDELKEIAARRDGQLPKPDETAGTGSPSAEGRAVENLTGLALSGGGIRSATFNLGVIQALAKNGILKNVDYLSTVSGGGYIGSCLSSLLNGTGQNAASTEWNNEFPFYHDAGEEEPPPLRHLRDFSNFLAPHGFSGVIQMPALLLRGFLTNLSVALPFVVFSAIFFSLVWGNSIEQAASPLDLYIITPYSFGVVVLFALGSLGAASWTQRGRERLRRIWVWVSLIPMFVLGVETIPAATAVVIILKEGYNLTDLGAAAGVIGGILPVLFAEKAAGKASKLTGKIALAAIGLLAPLVLLFLHSYLVSYLIEVMTSPFAFQSLGVIVVLGGLVFAWNLLRYNANLTSMLPFYRDRLTKAYLRKWNPRSSKTEDNSEQKLSELESRGPYHIINTTMNLQGSPDLTLHGRNSRVFVLSKRFCGYTDSTGDHYAKTADLEWTDRNLTLGTAMSVSAAAAAPNMGMLTVPFLTFLMTMLNIRLGYWLLHPDKCPKRSPNRRTHQRPPRKRPGICYLFREMMGKVDGKKYVNLTDGGHLENLGVYELLRRQCKLIIACDAEADPDRKFPSLARVIRFARIDWGIDIDIDVADLRKGANGQSLKGWAVGRIRYPDKKIGYLLYIKSSLLETRISMSRPTRQRIRHFRTRGTGDQFFSEAQFEAYRSLGHKIASTLCERVNPLRFVGNPEKLYEWAEELEAPLRPRGSLESERVGLLEELNALESEFKDSAISDYTREIYPEVALGGSSGADLQKIFWLCIRQLNFMENVFVQLELDKKHQREHHFNRGWMNLFRRWAASSFFADACMIAIGDYSVGFERFCRDKEILNLTHRLILIQQTDNKLENELPPDLYRVWRKVNGPDTTYVGYVEAGGRLATRFPVGFVAVKNQGGPQATARLYAVSERYRGMYYLAAMFRKLKQTPKGGLPAPEPHLRVRLNQGTGNTAAIINFFRKLEIPIVE